MKTKHAVIVLAGILILGISCKKKSAYEKLDGTWEVEEITLWGATAPGDGSTLSFTDCSSPPCPGTDYDGTNKTTGTFTYELLDDDKTLSITDTSSLGGSLDADWDVGTLTKSTLRITASTLLGDLTYKFSKK